MKRNVFEKEKFNRSMDKVFVFFAISFHFSLFDSSQVIAVIKNCGFWTAAKCLCSINLLQDDETRFTVP